MRMGQGVRTGLGHGGITCVLQTQFSSLNLFLGPELYLLTLHKRQMGQGNHGSPSKSVCVNATVVNCIR